MVFHVKYIDKKMIYLLLIFWRHLPSYDIDVSFNPNPYELSTTREGGLYFIFLMVAIMILNVEVGRYGIVGFVEPVSDCGCLGC